MNSNLNDTHPPRASWTQTVRERLSFAGRGRWLALPAAVISLAAILVVALTVLGVAGGGSAHANGPLQVKKVCPQESAVGQPVVYFVVIRNTSTTETLSIDAVNDPLLGGDILSKFSDTELSPGEATVSSSLLHFVQESDLPGPLVNVVTVDATDGQGATYFAQASCTLDVASLSLTKTAEFVNGTVVYTFVITNNGNVPLQRAFVEDSLLGIITLDFPVALAVGESVTVVIERDFNDQECDNTVTATYQSTTEFIHSRVSATAECGEGGGGPDFTASKVCSPKTGTVGVPIDVVVQVSNIGTDPLTNVTVADDQATLNFSSGDGGVIGDLEPSETWVYTGSYNPTSAGSHTNVVTVQATDPSGVVIERTDQDTCVRDDPPNGGGGTFPTDTDCNDFNGGQATQLNEIGYSLKRSGEIHTNLTPGVFFYFSEFTIGSAGTLSIVQGEDENSGLDYRFQVHSDFAKLFDGDCNSLGYLTVEDNNIDVTGQLDPGTYIVQIKYDSKSLAGFPEPDPTTVHYTFQTFVGLDLVDQDSDGLDLAPK